MPICLLESRSSVAFPITFMAASNCVVGATARAEGWTYMGTYFYVLRFGPYTAAQFWECTDYADFDTYRNHSDPIWMKLIEKAMEFGTPEPTAAWLLREVGDAKIAEPKKRP